MNKDNLYLYGEVSDSIGLVQVGIVGLNLELMTEIIDKKYPRNFDLEALQNMLKILKDELVCYANGLSHNINDNELETLIKTIRKFFLETTLQI